MTLKEFLNSIGRITSAYGVDRGDHKHSGIDVVLSNDNIPSFTAGTVAAAGYSSSYGWNIYIKDSAGYYHHYAHMASASPLQVGALVQKGQTIGTQGNTGNSRGKHLHYEVRTKTTGYGGQSAVDPNSYWSGGITGVNVDGSATSATGTTSVVGGMLSGITNSLFTIIAVMLLIGFAVAFLLRAFDISPSKIAGNAAKIAGKITPQGKAIKKATKALTKGE